MGITPTEAEMLEAALASALIDVHVSLPGKIESYDSITQTATVQLQVKRVLPKTGGGFATEDLPVLENVPVQFPRTKKFIITLPIETGDYGLVVFNEMSIDQWRSKGENTSPGDIGRHTLTGGVFQPGLSPLAETILPALLGGDDIGEDLVIGVIGGGQIRVKPGGSIEAVAGGAGGQSADDFVAMAAKVLTELESVKTAVDAHTHLYNPGPFAPAPTAPPAVPIPAPSSVASSNLKAND